MTENMKKLLDLVAGGKCICSFGGGGEYADGSVLCVCIIGGDGNW